MRISKPNVCHRSADFEPRARENQAMTENDEPKYDTEAAADSVHWVAETQSPALVPDLPAPDPKQLTRSDPAAPRDADNVSVEPDPNGVSGLLGGFP